MTDVVSTTVVSAGTVTGFAFGSYFAGFDAGVIIGAFAGAIFFVISAAEYNIPSRTGLGIISFLAGLIFSRPLSNFLMSQHFMINYSGELKWVEAALAFFVSAFVIFALMYVRNNGIGGIIKYIPFRWGRGNDK